MAQSTAGLTAKVREYREKIARDPELYEGDIDVVMWLVSDTVNRDWSPSEVARVVGINVTDAQLVLGELAAGKHIAHDERGAWTRYWSRWISRR